MGGAVRVDPVSVHWGGGHVFDTLQHAANRFIEHENAVTEAAEGWVGSSKLALGEIAEAWQSRHADHQRALTHLSQALIDAAARYTATDGDGAEAVSRLVQQMGL